MNYIISALYHNLLSEMVQQWKQIEKSCSKVFIASVYKVQNQVSDEPQPLGGNYDVCQNGGRTSTNDVDQTQMPRETLSSFGSKIARQFQVPMKWTRMASHIILFFFKNRWTTTTKQS